MIESDYISEILQLKEDDDAEAAYGNFLLPCTSFLKL